MIKISIIVPVYNAQPFLRKCIDGIVNQTIKEIEIILINDGSTDQSLKICNEFAKVDERIVIINQENRGVSFARNQGIEVAKGEYIAFVDADDWIEKNFCEIAYDSTNKFKYDLIFFNSYEHSAENVKKTTIFKEKEKEIKGGDKNLIFMLLNSNRFKKDKKEKIIIGGPCCKLYKTKFLKENNITFNTNILIHEDDLLNILAIEKANNILYINNNLYHIRRNNFSSTRRYMPNAIINIKNTINAYNEIFSNLKYSQDYHDCFNERIIGLFIILNSLYFSNPQNPNKLKDLHKELKNILLDDIFYNAFKNVELRYLDKKRKLAVYILRRKLYYIFLLFGKLNNSIKNIKSFKKNLKIFLALGGYYNVKL